MLTSDATPLGPREIRWAIRVHDLSQARAFYGGLLGCREAQDAKPADRAMSFDFFGARLAVLLADAEAPGSPTSRQQVLDVCLALPQWRNLAQRLMAAGTRFEVPPHCHHEGSVDERWTMDFRDPSGNALSFRAHDAQRRRCH